ncbi:MAG: GntR family transcriptional regulator [Proteobacteria bacterium]|nr:GntR family transcriptional regulator [Pseudomonadota bacterium]
MQQKRLDSNGPLVRLNFQIDPHSFVPYYQQIVEQVRDLIKSEAVQAGDVFQSEGELASALGISKMPVRQAFAKLRSEGLLVIEKGRRPTIGSGQVPWNFQELRGFTEEMKRRGLTPSTRVLKLEEMPADAEIAQALGLQPTEAVFTLQRLRYVNGKPVALVTSYLPATLFPDLAQQNLAKVSLYHLFEKSYGRTLSWAEEEIGATAATEEQARKLETSVGSPLLFVRETTYDARRIAIEHSHSWLRGDRYTANVISVRKRG